MMGHYTDAETPSPVAPQLIRLNAAKKLSFKEGIILNGFSPPSIKIKLLIWSKLCVPY
jgi:hypothetical protein